MNSGDENAAAKSVPMGRRLALLIATYQYQDTGLRQLTTPAQDAEAFATVLQDPAIAGFEVTTLVNEAHYRVGEAIAELYRDRRRDDLTLLYFTGHGLKDDDGRLYLAMSNTRRDSLLFTTVSAEQVDQAMESCVSRQKVLILDCCYSGAFPAGRIAKADTTIHTLERFQGRGRTVLTASDATQYSFEGNQLHGQAVQSVFTRYLVAGLRDGNADLDSDGDITLDELYSYVHDRVVEEMPQQRPKKQDNVEGRIVIARNVNWTLPIYLRNAIGSPIATDRLAALDGLAHLYRIGNDTVRGRVREEIERLTDDDSRLVSAAATTRLQSIQSAPTEIRHDPPGKQTPDAPPPATHLIDPELATPTGLSPTTAAAGPAISDPGPHTADQQPPTRGLASGGLVGVFALAMAVAAYVPVRAGDDASGDGAGIAAAVLVFTTTAAVRLLTSKDSEGERTPGPRRHKRLATVPGLLAIVASVLLLAGVDQQPFAASTHGFWESLPWYILGMAAVAVAAGVCTLLPLTRSLIGPGLMLGAAAASTWGLVFFAGELVRGHGDVARWVEFVGHLTLMLAAFLAGRAVRRHRLAHLRLRRPRNARTWVAVILGGLAAGVGALAMSLEVYQVTQLRWDYDQLPAGDELFNRAFAYRATMVLAVCVPLYAAIAAPRRFGWSVLVGWIGGAAAIALSTDVYVLHSDGTDPEPIFVFGCALFLLALVATGMALLPGLSVFSAPADLVATPARHGHAPIGVGLAVPSRRRTLLLAGLAVIPLLITAAGAAVAFRAGETSDDESTVHALAISPDGRQVYVTRNNSFVYVIDAARQTVVGSAIDIGGPINALAVSPDGSRLYVATDGGVSVIDTQTSTTVGPPVPVGGPSERMAVSPGGSRLYVATDGGVSVIDTQTSTTVGTAGAGLYSLGAVAVSLDGSRLYVTSYKNGVSVIDTQTNATVGTPIPAGDQSDRMAVSPDGRRLYVASDKGVLVIDTETRTTVGTPIPGNSPAVSPDGRRLYIITDYDEVSVIDTQTNTTVESPIPAGFNPVDMVLSPDGRYVYVSHYDGDSVWMIDTATRRTVGIPIPADHA